MPQALQQAVEQKGTGLGGSDFPLSKGELNSLLERWWQSVTHAHGAA